MTDHALKLDRLEMHIRLDSVLHAIKKKKKKPASFPSIVIPYFAIRGLTLVTEKALGNPFAPDDEAFLNIWGLLGESLVQKKSGDEMKQIHKNDEGVRAKDAEKKKAEKKARKKTKREANPKSSGGKKGKGKRGKNEDDDEKEDDDEEDIDDTNFDPKKHFLENLTPKDRAKYESQLERTLGVKFKFQCDMIVIADVYIYAADLISDLMGGGALKDATPMSLNPTLNREELYKDNTT
eukprot:FR740719.1.p1 GENE.FR740719.1~~FR740719.1.p1  ORF type:complete len:268 (+),score=51.58 FR740719.1:96-806(+)